MAASAIAVFALFALAVRPQWNSQVSAVSALLLTSDAEKSSALQADSLQSVALKFALADEAPINPLAAPPPQTIPDLNYLKRRYPQVRHLHVLGHGMRDYDWQELDSVAITPHFAPLPEGFKFVSWPRALRLGQTLRMQGEVAREDRAKHWLALIDPGGVVDSLALAPRSTTFEFHATPRDTGFYLYTLRLQSETGRALAEEKLAVHVTPPRPLRILILESSAKFETKYLKHWAAQRQCRVAIRTAISRGRYRFEFLNQPRRDLTALTPALLRDFDLIITEGRALQSLSIKERRVLRDEVEKEGLGVLLFADEVALAPTRQNFPEADFFLPFRFEAFRDLEQRSVKPRWPDAPASALTAIPSEPVALLPTWSSTALMQDEQERALVAAAQSGQGRVALSLLHETYRWILEDHAQWHASYWAHLFAELARQEQHREVWALPSDRPICVDQPLAVTLTTTNTLPFGIIKTSHAPPDSFFLRQDEIEPSRWSGTYWPRATGWHEVATPGGEPSWFYVHAQDEWQTWQRALKILATSHQAQRFIGREHVGAQRAFTKTETIPPLWFFLVFVLSCAYLWLERKL